MFLKQRSEKACFHLFLCIFISLHCTLANENVRYNPLHNNCGKIYANDKGALAYNGKQTSAPENLTCSWFFDFPPNDENDIYMDVKNFALFENDTFVVKNRLSGKVIFGPFTGFLSPFIIATGTRNVEAQLITSSRKYHSERSFLINYSTKECSTKLIGHIGVISSPVYAIGRKEPLHCQYKLEGYGVSQKSQESLSLTFVNMTLRNSVINITSSTEKELISTSTPDFPKIYFGKGIVTMDVSFDTKNFDSFRILYEVVPDACSGIIDLNPNNSSTSISFLSLVSPNLAALTRNFITCNWLIRSPPGTRIRAAFSSLKLLSLDDRLVISSPQFEKFSPLHLSASNNHLFKDKQIVSPTNEFWVKFSTMQILPGLSFAADFSIFKDNGLLETEGKLTIKDVGDYHFRVQKDKVVNLELGELIGPDTVLDLYYTLDSSDSHFLTLDEKYTLKWVVSPTNELKIVAKHIEKSKNINIQFHPTDKGCNQTIVDNQGALDFNAVDCQQKCLFVFPAKISTDIYNFNIESPGIGVKISSLYKNPNYLLEQSYSESTINADIHVPVEDGVLFEISRKCKANRYNQQSGKITYLTQESCGRKFAMSVGENVALASPNYPENYPLNTKCHWFFEPNDHKSLFYYVTFNQFAIEKRDKFIFKTLESEISLGNYVNNPRSALPDDLILKSAFSVNFESQYQMLPVRGRSYKFSLQSTAIDCGGIETSSKGSLSIAIENLPNLCIWLISVPLKTDPYYTNIVVSTSNERTGITIYDGPSVRSPILKFTKEGISSSNKIIILYKPRESHSNIPFKIEYHSIACNGTFACRTGLCMKPEWKCNGLNECGDYSDEYGCSVTSPINKKTTSKVEADLTMSMNLVSTVPDDLDSTTSGYDGLTGKVVDDSSHKVLQADSQVSIATLAAAVVGCFVVTVIIVGIIAYLWHKKTFRNSSMYKNRWETLSTSNPSYQSEKDCIDQLPPRPVAHISVTQESARHHDNRKNPT